MNRDIKMNCLSLDCPERFSLCCGAGSRAANEGEIMLGVPEFYCAKCGEEFVGGECTAAERNNYMQVGRTIECGNCHPEKYEHCSKVPFPNGCKCICHNEPSNESWEQILKQEGLTDWQIKISSGGAICFRKTKQIILTPNHGLAMFLHEVAHAKAGIREDKTGHDAFWADEYTRLVNKYMKPNI